MFEHLWRDEYLLHYNVIYISEERNIIVYVYWLTHTKLKQFVLCGLGGG